MNNWLTIILSIGLFTGCRKEADSTAPSTAESDTGAVADEWLEVEDDDEGDDDDDDKPDDDDDDKPDDDFGGYTLNFQSTVDLESGTGTFLFEFDSGSGLCSVSGDLVDVADVEGCADCSVAKTMTLKSVSVEGDDCGSSSEYEGETQTFGHGNTEVFEYDDVGYHALYELDPAESPDWTEVADGYSWIDGTTWVFSIKA